MSRPFFGRLMIFALAALALAGCREVDERDYDPDEEADSGADAASDTDTDSDGDADSGADTDSDSDSDSDSECDTDPACEGCVVEFADPNLDYYVRFEISKPTGVLCAEDVAGITELQPSGMGIGDLQGIEYCASLYMFNAAINEITDLSPLAGLTELYDLWLDENYISDLSPLAGLTSLNYLEVYSNQVTDLSPLTGLTALIDVILSTNNITDLSPLVANEGLASGDYIDLNDNPIDETAQAANINALCDRGVLLVPYCP